jgi:hypothetical protein
MPLDQRSMVQIRFFLYKSTGKLCGTLDPDLTVHNQSEHVNATTQSHPLDHRSTDRI